MKKLIQIGTFLLVIMIWSGCSEDDHSINIFSLQDDITLGNQVDQEITSKPQDYPLVDSVQYAAAYQHLYRIRNAILASGKVKYAQTFRWKMRIIRNDTMINAFCVPGGNIYVYTGIIKLLENEAQFAGVMAHEMAHADRRHSTDALTLNYGLQVLLSVVLGNNPSVIEEIAAGLASGLGTLAFSRSNEYEADKYAVTYLYSTEYDAASLADFFVKMHGQPTPPTFLSTHPSPDDRVQKINETFTTLGGVHGGTFPERYQQFKNTLP